MKHTSFVLLTSALLLVPGIFSANTHKEVMGTVKSIDSTRIELVVKGGKVVSFPITKSTMVMRGKDMVGADQVQPGMDVVVVLAEDEKTAENIKLSPASEKK
jgi:hypothetical protein